MNSSIYNKHEIIQIRITYLQQIAFSLNLKFFVLWPIIIVSMIRYYEIIKFKCRSCHATLHISTIQIKVIQNVHYCIRNNK